MFNDATTRGHIYSHAQVQTTFLLFSSFLKNHNLFKSYIFGQTLIQFIESLLHPTNQPFAAIAKVHLQHLPKTRYNSIIMPKPLSHIKIALRRSSERGHAEHGGWLKTYHTFSFADYFDHRFLNFGCLRVLNEDRVAARNGFPLHPHRDAEIFSYILSGELTHRDSMIKKGAEGAQGKQFYRMRRGDVQFTTGGTGKDPLLM
jgi:hypothetical protein